MVAKFRLLSLFVLANAMGSLTMILPASPADRDRGGAIAHEEPQAGGSESHRAGTGGDNGGLSLLVTHDVFYQNCFAGGDCGGARGDRDKDLRPDLIGGETPSNFFPFGGGADDGHGHGSDASGHDTAGAGSAAPGGFPSALFPFMPPAPFTDAPGGGPGGGRSGSAGSGSAGSGGNHTAGNSAADYPGLTAGTGAPHGGGDWQPIPIPSGAGVSGSDPAVSTADAVPEPASFPLLASAALMVLLFRPHWRPHRHPRGRPRGHDRRPA